VRQSGCKQASGRMPWVLLVGVAGLSVVSGCHAPPRAETLRLANPVLGPLTVAVAPALNHSGSRDFDPARFADTMARELSYAEGIAVVPVSRVLAVLTALGTPQIESPAHAWQVARLVGADALLVFAVTDYDPYDPPRIGISAQLYGVQPGPGGGGVDPVDLSRAARLASSSAAARPPGLLAQTQRTFDAACASTVHEVRQFARQRGGDGTPYGWRRYLVSQRDYISFCCRATLGALLSDGVSREGAGGAAREAGTP